MKLQKPKFYLKQCPRCKVGDLLELSEVRPIEHIIYCIQCGFREDFIEWRDTLRYEGTDW